MISFSDASIDSSKNLRPQQIPSEKFKFPFQFASTFSQLQFMTSILLVVKFIFLVRFDADNWNKLKNLCSKTIGSKMKVYAVCSLETIEATHYELFASVSC